MPVGDMPNKHKQHKHLGLSSGGGPVRSCCIDMIRCVSTRQTLDVSVTTQPKVIHGGCCQPRVTSDNPSKGPLPDNGRSVVFALRAPFKAALNPYL